MSGKKIVLSMVILYDYRVNIGKAIARGDAHQEHMIMLRLENKIHASTGIMKKSMMKQIMARKEKCDCEIRD